MAADSAKIRELESVLQPGDVLFTSIPNFLYRRVARATGSQTSHVGIAFYDADKGWRVAESAVPAARYSTLTNFIERSDNGWLVVRRVKGGLSADKVNKLRQECNARLGKWYHFGFDYHARGQFCSKFVYQSYLDGLAMEIGELQKFQALLDSLPDTPLLFWRLWFLGRIPWQRLTVTPGSQFNSDKLETVWHSDDHRP